MSELPRLDLGPVDTHKVEQAYVALTDLSWAWGRRARRAVFDRRIADAQLNLAEKRALLERLAPPAEAGLAAITDPRRELRLERLLLSVDPPALARFRFALEYDGDYKDLEEYLFHDIDDAEVRARVLDHWARSAPPAGVKSLSDADDTLFASLVDRRYPPKHPYPGVCAFHAALAREPFTPPATPITLLSARPELVGGVLEEMSQRDVWERFSGRLLPSVLTGELVSSTLGTLETLWRAHLPEWGAPPNGQEERIGLAKFNNAQRFGQVYPDYRLVFSGDSGQADALTASLLLEPRLDPRLATRVVTTFIHDLDADGECPQGGRSPTFQRERARWPVDEHGPSGRGIIAHRNYIHAARLAYQHSEGLGGLVDAVGLARVCAEALEELLALRQAYGPQAVSPKAQAGYRQEGRQVLALLDSAAPEPPSAWVGRIHVALRTLAEA